MKFIFNKQLMVLMLLLLNCFAGYAANEDLITKQITLKLTEAGTLPNKIGSSKKNLVTNLKIIGEINGTDLRFIREMAGSDVEGNSTSGNLSVLDLSEARFVEGGDSYYDVIGCYTSNDIIGQYAFYGCSSLTSVNIPSSVTSIGWRAFESCSSLTSVNIPSGVTEIGVYTFSGCRSLTSVNIPSSVTVIGGRAFSDCSSLTNINIPSSVKWIGESTFSGCSSLTSVNIPSSVTVIGGYAFGGCSSLTSVNIPSSVTEIRESTFSDCSSLTSVNIPSSVTEIREYAFDGCSSLISVKIPSSVTSIGGSAFSGCSGLRSIYVYAETVPSTVAGAFEGCDSKNCTVYVPKGTYDAYWLSEWGYFDNIVEFDATNIRNIVAEPEAQETARYAVNGQRLTAPVKGINLVKYNNGRVKKEIVK
ncbi:leucine-rich repeat domain-containing protein [Prevotellamassilia timonensis]|uniref:leucine-rich repeat domain-containing protein n=1 Tax=Prevotellamassilia timonensis TaxID=1852370 RepID=UPI00307D0271